MNKIHRLIWSTSQRNWVVVAETTSSCGKRSQPSRIARLSAKTHKPARSRAQNPLKLLMTALVMITAGIVHAAPTGGDIISGSGRIRPRQDNLTTTIDQTSQKLVINWQDFSIGASESVRFNQPDASSIALNRVLGQNPSEILGNLSANGQVFITNPNGVLFGAGAQVNVGGMVATSLGISDADFNAGNYSFTRGTTAGSVVNQGTLTASDSGYIALLGPQVKNEGVISAQLGTALLAAGDKINLSLNNGSLVSYNIEQGAIDALAENKNLIRANGGKVFMNAQAAQDALAKAVVNNTGIIEAQALENHDGTIMLLADMQKGTVNVSGTLDASAPNGGNGGFIETSAAHVKIADGTQIKTNAAQGQAGNWLIDPMDFTIANSGGDISATTLATNLGSGNVTIQSTSGASGANGDVFVNDAVTWSANKLTLNAQRNIVFNANINASGTASLALEYGQSAVAAGNTSTYSLSNGVKINLPAGQNFSTKLGSDGATTAYTVITALGAAGSTTTTDLQGINGGKAGKYVLGGDIDASGTSAWNAGAGFNPLGDSGTKFTGKFDGLGHTISGLYINRGSQQVGMFGYANGATIANVGVINASVTSTNWDSGILLGNANNSTISNSYTTGTLTSANNAGGLAGVVTGSTVSNSYSTANISGSGTLGGLVGLNNTGSTISNSYATGTVSGTSSVGGLVGLNKNTATITGSHATGAVTGNSDHGVGGLVGESEAGAIITLSYATGTANQTGGWGGRWGAGGLVGINYGVISKSYATGAVNSVADGQVGGLAGHNGSTGSITDSYSTGSATSSISVGGFVGQNNGGSITNSYSSGAAILSGGGAGGFIGSYISGTITNSYWNKTTSGNNTSAGGAGVTGKTSAEMMQLATFSGWSMSNAGGSSNTWRIYEGSTGPLLRDFLTSVTVTAANASKTYDGNAYTGGNGVTYSVGVPPTLSGSVSYGGTSQSAVNAGSYSITASGLYSTQAQGYDISYASGSLTVAQKALTISGSSAANKTYDGTTTASVTAGSLVGLVGAETLGVSGSGTFDTKNAGTGKTVTASYSLSDGSNGGLASNYTLANNTTTADIAAKALSISGTTAANKTYDGATTASVTAGSLSGFVGAETVSVSSASGTFDTKNAGTGKTVTASYSLSDGANGGLASNYTLANNTTTADIAAKALSISGTTAANKTYDGATTASVTAGSLSGFVGAETVSVSSASGTFDTKNAGTGKTVTASYSLSDGSNGGLASNYTLANNTTTADIAAKALSISATAANKTYDGNTTATVSGTLSGLVGAETLGVSGSGTFDTKNVGTGKTVSASYSLSNGSNGGLASNYTLASNTLSADISAKALSIAGTTAANKMYDGTRSASVSAGSLSGLVGSETLGVTGSGTFDTKDVGAGKTVAVSYGLSNGNNGGLASNYSLADGSTSANITAVPITADMLSSVTKTTPVFSDSSLGKPLPSPILPTQAGSTAQAMPDGGLGDVNAVLQPAGTTGKARIVDTPPANQNSTASSSKSSASLNLSADCAANSKDCGK